MYQFTKIKFLKNDLWVKKPLPKFPKSFIIILIQQSNKSLDISNLSAKIIQNKETSFIKTAKTPTFDNEKLIPLKKSDIEKVDSENFRRANLFGGS